ncbi:protein PfhB1 [Rodentibacter pneumotropicus]|uniref:Protein PfhB1 n=1 Tax=Rodentibacter pneumotropicus TaxID=758 RepID=A0A3S4TU17_9PAST|nr:protein PfhB1 [Rodentibacter pneumotropicus]
MLANLTFILFHSGSLSMQKFSLSKITISLSLCYVTQFSYADIQTSNSNTQVTRQKGVEIVNIATPSQSGLSHNQYNKFNVDKAGAVLNNGLQTSQTQLAGEVGKNPNLRTQAATVILNEVVSHNPSYIAGKQEIAGQKADYVLANPNGISVDGGGFINTPRASLVVGKATVESGKLTGYSIDGEQGLTTKGTMSGATNVDLIAPTVNVSGNLQSDGNVNILQGHNKIERADNGELTVSVLPQQEKVLDGTVAGSIQAGRIRIHSTDDRASLEVTGSNLTAKQVTVTGGNVKLNGKMVNNTTSSSKNISDKDRLVGKGKLRKDTQQFDKTYVKADSATVVASNHLTLEGADIQAKDVVLVGGKTHLGTVKTKERTISSEDRAKGNAKISESSFGTTEKAHSTKIVSDNLKLIATDGKLTGDASKINAQNLVLHGEKGVTFQGVTEQSYYADSSTFKIFRLNVRPVEVHNLQLLRIMWQAN